MLDPGGGLRYLSAPVVKYTIEILLENYKCFTKSKDRKI